MDFGTIIGIIGGFSLIIGAISLGGDFLSFFNIPGLMIVIGGTVMTTLITQSISVVLGSFRVALNAFIDKSDSPEKIIKLIMKLAEKARKDGILALEKVKIGNKHLARGVRMVADGMDHDEIVRTMEIGTKQLVKRHKTGQKVFKFMAGVAPAMGMIGTIIGLVQMLKNLQDPEQIGPAMAVALLTTFYGAVMAFFVFKPIAEKLEVRTSNEKEILEIVLAGVGGISKGLGSLALKEKLMTFLPPSQRKG